MNGLLRRANALSKIVFAVSLCAYAFICPDWRVLAAFLCGLLVLLALTRALDRTIWLAAVVLAAGVPVLLVLFVWGGIEKSATWQAGVWLGLGGLGVFCLRLAIMLLADLVVVKLTTFSNMLLSLRTLRLPGRLVLFVSALISLLPNMCAVALRVIEVQRCRGFEMKKLWRPSGFLPLFIPVFLAQMRRSTDLALSLELRGVGGDALKRGGRLTFGLGDGVFLVIAGLIWLGPAHWGWWL